MRQHIYISGAEAYSGKSLVTLAVMEYLFHTEHLGFFRPVVRSENDKLIEKIVQIFALPFQARELYGVTYEEAQQDINSGSYAALVKKILNKFKILEAKCQRVVCTGSDFSISNPLEFDFNADLANNLGCLILPVISGAGKTSEEIQTLVNSYLTALQDRGNDLLFTVVNRTDNALIDSLKQHYQTSLQTDDPVFVIPEEPELSHIRVQDIVEQLHFPLVYGDSDQLNRSINGTKVAAMGVEGFLQHINRDCLVIVPQDRHDIILTCIASYPSRQIPRISAILLTGGGDLPHNIKQLFHGLDQMPFPILASRWDTYQTTIAVHALKPQLVLDDTQLASMLGLAEKYLPRESFLKHLTTEHSRRLTPMMFEHQLIQMAKTQRKHIVLPEGEDERILKAAEILIRRDVVDLTILGNEQKVRDHIRALGLDLKNTPIIDPNTSSHREEYAQKYFELRQHKGISLDMAMDIMCDVSYYGTMMVYFDHAHGMVSGAAHTTQHTIRPSFEFIRTRPGASIVSSVFFMCLQDRVLVYGDCAVMPNPDADQLADIAISSAETASMFGIEPVVAMLSYSTGTSGKGEDVDRVRQATEKVKQLKPELAVEGPIQYDAAIDIGVAKKKLPESSVAGRASIFIFPDLNTGNNTYKAVQRSSGAVAVGPVLQGLKKPVNDLSRGCKIPDIVNTVAITAIQAQYSIKTE